MSDLAKKLQSIPRSVTALITFVIVIFPFLVPLNIPVPVTPETQDFVDFINALPEGAVVAFGFDCGVWHWVRTGSSSAATLNLLFQKDVKIVIWSTTAAAEGLFPQLLDLVNIPENKVYGEDWVYFGFVSGTETALQQMALNLKSPGDDYLGTPLTELPVMDGIDNWEDVDLVVQNGASGEWPKMYVRQWSAPYGVPLVTLQTPVNTLMNLPFRASEDINWVLWGNVGGAELEAILGYKSWGHQNTDAQNLIHLFTIIMVVLGNIGLFLERTGGIE
jgi:hypothetical protein